MDGRGDRGESVAIIGMACRFPGARDPAEFHDLVVAGRDMFQPVAALPGRPLRAAVLDDWSAPQIADDPVTGGLWPDVGPVRKLAAEMTALALTDAGLREVAGTCRTGLIIASSVPELGEQVREEFGFPARGASPARRTCPRCTLWRRRPGPCRRVSSTWRWPAGPNSASTRFWLALQDRAGALSAGEMHVYAADPAGLLPGEGCGMVVLVRAADARAAGVPVYAEIAGWSTPPADSERSGPVLLQAYQRAGVDPADVQLIEGQGIGTAPGIRRTAALTQLRRSGLDHGTVAALARFPPASATPGRRRASRAWSRRPWPWPRDHPARAGCPGPHPSHRARRCSGCPAGALAAAPLVRRAPGGPGCRGELARHDRPRGASGHRACVMPRAYTSCCAGGRDRPLGRAAGRVDAEVREGAAVRECGGARVFVLRGGDRGRSRQLDVIAASAAALTDDGLDGLARQLAADAVQAAITRCRCG